MDFDKLTERRGSGCGKWDFVQNYYKVGDDALPMWVADSDFEVPEAVTRALQAMVDHRIYGYLHDFGPYKAAIRWWMKTRHGWEIESDEAILTTFGLVNAVGVAMDVYTEPGDAIMVFAPVYHAFGRVIRAAGRTLTEAPLAERDGRMELDIDAAEAALTGREKMLIWCSPHNPGSRLWTAAENQAVADFARRHDLLLIADEIHHDIVMPGFKHSPMALAEGVRDRLLMLTATSKVFNLAGFHSGNVTIEDPTLRRAFTARLGALGLSTNMAGIIAATAAYSPEGAEWADAQNVYVAENFRVFGEGLAGIPGVRMAPAEATYLAWADFRGTGMDQAEIVARIEQGAGIAASHGPQFGLGGDGHMRFNLGTQRARVLEAVERLRRAFADLQ